METMLKWKPDKGAIAYSATSLATGFMHPIVQFYYVKVFLDKFNIQSNWFQAVQVIYMIWNAINDPLFGYCQDNCQIACMRKRRHAMLFGGPLFALSFLQFWFQWGESENSPWICGIHLLVALCFYDSMFTYVLLAQGCILAEMTNIHENRLRMLQYANCAYLIGSASVFLCETFSDHLDRFVNFQMCVIVFAIIAWIALTYTGKYTNTIYDVQETKNNNVSGASTNLRKTNDGIFKLTWQILSNSNFKFFVIMNFMTEIHVNFLVNFCSIITDNIVSKSIMPELGWNIYYGMAVTLPKVITTIYRPLLSRFGYYDVLKVLFTVKVFSGLLMFVIGRHSPVFFLLFILLDSVTSSMAASMMGLVMTDIIDSDQKIHNRSHPLSSMVFGTNALVTKPAQSIAPMLTVAVLQRFGYDKYKTGTLANPESLKHCMFALACVIPVVIGTVQFISWSKYKIRDTHRTIVKYIEA